MALRVRSKYSLRRSVTPQRMAAAERRKASVKKTTYVSGVMALLLVAGGVGYTWYTGEHTSNVVAAKAPAPSRRVEWKPVKQDPNANVGVSVQALTTPVQPGQNASISVRTNQLANCTIAVMYGKVPGTDSGLAKKSADEYGSISWSWSVAQTAPVGKATVKVDCANKTKSGSVTADLDVTR